MRGKSYQRNSSAILFGLEDKTEIWQWGCKRNSEQKERLPQSLLFPTATPLKSIPQPLPVLVPALTHPAWANLSFASIWTTASGSTKGCLNMWGLSWRMSRISSGEEIKARARAKTGQQENHKMLGTSPGGMVWTGSKGPANFSLGSAIFFKKLKV